MATRVLVAYGSEHGSTAEIAEWIGHDLRARGMTVDVVSAGQVENVDGYDAVVLGGALCAGVWHRDARRFARRYGAALHGRPVWLFSSGPLDHSAEERDIEPVRSAAHAARRLDARGHVTFGGRLRANARGFPASAMAATKAGDYRDRDQVRSFANRIANALLPEFV